MRVTKRQTNTLASERDSIRHHLGTLLFQESHSHASPRPRQSRRQRSPTEEEIACEICQSLAHITTECPTTPNLVYDQADTPPSPLRPDESLALPASWLALHQATLHYLVSSVIQYFRILHDGRSQRIDLLRTIHHLLDIATLPVQEHEIPTQQGDQDRDLHLFDHAVNKLVTLLHNSPFPVSGVEDAIFVAICVKYYSPFFGHTLEEYTQVVYSRSIN
jgi:hypothetical protein